jgi:DNA invertase Pin-like site-specific DNA recombinase
LRHVAKRAGWEVVKVYKDHGISGSKGRDARPAFDALHKAAARREFDVVRSIAANKAKVSSGRPLVSLPRAAPHSRSVEIVSSR